jgi:nucleoside diphosphate kinase
MSNKTTMILTFIVTVVVPFIQEVVDLIEALKGKASSNTVAAKKVASDFQTDVAQLVEPVVNKSDSKKTSRFFGSWRDAK